MFESLFQLPLEIFLLIAFGIVFVVLLLLNNLIKTLRSAEKIGFWELFLTFLVLSLFILAAVYRHSTPDLTSATVETVIVVVSVVVGVISLLLMLGELRRPQKLKGSRGILGLGLALLLAISTQLVPRLGEQMTFVPPTPQLVLQNVANQQAVKPADDADQDDAAPVRETDAPTETPIPPTATFTATPRPSATPSPTRERLVFATRTPQPTPTLGNPCLVMTLYNVRLRAMPSGEADTLATIPFETNLTAFAQSADNGWYFVEFEGQTGWIDGEFVSASSSCGTLSVRDA